MKTKTFFSLVLVALVFLTACEKTPKDHLIVNDFEDVILQRGSWIDGSAKQGQLQQGSYFSNIITGTVQLLNKYTEGEWGGFWSGFALSAAIDSVTPGFVNQYSTIAGSGFNGSANFALAYDSAIIFLPYINSYQKPQSVMLTNSTWAYFDMKHGSDFSKKFAAGDWFKVIITGFLGGNETGKVEFYLADFRNAKSIIVREWTKVNLTSLGTTDLLTFTFDSSDKGPWGINTPKYVCIDDLVVAVSENCGCVND